jgi:hypothetical protein
MGMEVLHCKTVDGVQKELWMFLLIYNLMRSVMVAASSDQKICEIVHVTQSGRPTSVYQAAGNSQSSERSGVVGQNSMPAG